MSKSRLVYVLCLLMITTSTLWTSEYSNSESSILVNAQDSQDSQGSQDSPYFPDSSPGATGYTLLNVSFDIESSVGSANVSWDFDDWKIAVNGSEIFFTSISTDKVNFAFICISHSNCLLENLVPNTTYYVQIEDYDKRRSKLANFTTEPDPSNYCIFEKGEGSQSSQPCLGHGTCWNAQCMCDNGWMGEFCNLQAPKGELKQEGKLFMYPKIQINSDNMYYAVQVLSIKEYSSKGNQVDRLDLDIIGWDLKISDNDTVINPITNESLIRQEMTFFADNIAGQTPATTITVTYTRYFGDPNHQPPEYLVFPHTFANHPHSVRLGSIMCTIRIDSWNFNNMGNFLDITTSISPVLGGGSCANWSKTALNPSGQLTTLNIMDPVGNIITGRFVNRAVLDGVTRSIIHFETTDADLAEFDDVYMVTMAPSFISSLVVESDFGMIVRLKKNNYGCPSKVIWKVVSLSLLGLLLAFIFIIGTIALVLIIRKSYD